MSILLLTNTISIENRESIMIVKIIELEISVEIFVLYTRII